MAYLDTKGKYTSNNDPNTKPEIHREISDKELTEYSTAAGRLAWIGTGTSHTSACIVSMALQGKKKTVSLLQSFQDEYKNVAIEKIASPRYVTLDFDTIHVCVSS